jgi:hypothetical protein
MDVKSIRSEIRQIKVEMKAKGIRRSSCFNGGHSPESYRLNAEMFRLSLLLDDAKRRTQSA